MNVNLHTEMSIKINKEGGNRGITGKANLNLKKKENSVILGVAKKSESPNVQRLGIRETSVYLLIIILMYV